MKKIFFSLVAVFSFSAIWAQTPNDDLHSMPEYMRSGFRKIIRIPDVKGFHSLKCDLHTHTVFSDGNVWPTVRVDEAWHDGLDAVAITDHVEYHPREKYVKGDLNTSYEIAKQKADEIGFLLIKGTEITRKKPDGHMNALFIQDANKIKVDKAADAVEEAYRQGAVVMLNHPGWPDNKSTMDTMHIRFMKEGKIQLIEVFNSKSFYPKVVGWVNDYNLGPAASSDIHDLISTRHPADADIRPMTLVLAKERSLEGIKEALLAKRTIAFFNQHISGQQEWVQALFDACLQINLVADNNKKKRYTFEICNNSDIGFILKTKNGTEIRLRPNSIYRMNVGYKSLDTSYEVVNTHIGLNTHLVTSLPFAKAIQK